MYYNVLLCNTIYYYGLPVTALNRLDTEILGRGKLYYSILSLTHWDSPPVNLIVRVYQHKIHWKQPMNTKCRML